MLQNTKDKNKVLTTRERKSSIYKGMQLSRPPTFQEEQSMIKDNGMIFQNMLRENSRDFYT